MSSVRGCGLDAVQLALDPLREASERGGGAWALEQTRRVLAEGGISIVSGMIGMVGEDYSTLETIRWTGGVRPDRHWQQNLHNAHVSAAIAQALGLELVTFHAGFVPHSVEDEEFHVIAHRVAEVADAFAERGIAVALETGQEPAEVLPGFLECAQPAMHQTTGSPFLNFDPANMILYGSGDPVGALRRVAPFVRQVHVKDALPASSPGVWGTEVPAGAGAVDWRLFFRVLREHCPDAGLVIERESGDRRVQDVRRAVELVRSHTG